MTLDAYFDYRSPFPYLAIEPLAELARRLGCLDADHRSIYRALWTDAEDVMRRAVWHPSMRVRLGCAGTRSVHVRAAECPRQPREIT